MPHRVIVRRVGLRGEAMLGLGIIWGLLGIGALLGTGQRAPELALWHTLIPRPLSGALWLASAAVAVLAARFQRWSHAALGVLTVMPMTWLSSYLWGWVMSLVPGPPPGFAGGWYPALFYLVLVAMVVHVAHVPALSPELAVRSAKLGKLRARGGRND